MSTRLFMQSSQPWYSWAGFILIAVAIHYRRTKKDADVQTNKNGAILAAPKPFPWEPSLGEDNASIANENNAKCQRPVEDAQQQLQFMASMTFATQLRPPSCPCCR